MNRKTNKTFDCVEMKRQIQERMYQETRGMSCEERIAYSRRRISESRFASFLDRSPNVHPPAR